MTCQPFVEARADGTALQPCFGGNRRGWAKRARSEGGSTTGHRRASVAPFLRKT